MREEDIETKSETKKVIIFCCYFTSLVFVVALLFLSPKFLELSEWIKIATSPHVKMSDIKEGLDKLPKYDEAVKFMKCVYEESQGTPHEKLEEKTVKTPAQGETSEFYFIPVKRYLGCFCNEACVEILKTPEFEQMFLGVRLKVLHDRDSLSVPARW